MNSVNYSYHYSEYEKSGNKIVKEDASCLFEVPQAHLMPYHDLPTATALSLVMVVLAFDCDYNRSTTEDKALFFSDSESAAAACRVSG